MRLLNDIARCYGHEDEDICSTCARKAQIRRDQIAIEVERRSQFFSYIHAKPDGGGCCYYIDDDAGIPASE